MTFLQADAGRLPFADKSVDLVFTSPPYIDARTYGIDAQRNCRDWIAWMLDVVAECVRVCKGLVLIVCAGVTRKWRYQPGPEGLLYEWWRRGGNCWRPCYWHRSSIPGSGGKQWLRADIEYVLAFTDCLGAIPWADNTANGHPPKFASSGKMTHRHTDGSRVTNGKNYKRFEHAKDGSVKGDHDRLLDVKIANPGNIVKVIVGGGLMGPPECHENEAPFPQKLAEWFIRGWCPPGGTVLDPFSGSGTTVHAALSLGRRAIGCDLRYSQCELGRRRCANVQVEMFT